MWQYKMLSGIEANQMNKCVHIMVNQSKNWSSPEGYDHKNVSNNVIKIVVGGIKIV